ncbi:MAG: RHS repeat-associated core domain-containing protein, partial [Phycisphaerales bacterium]|nr:RHS repeat-associated core domain-containing protein [Phycisphaerales bacterium]
RVEYDHDRALDGASAVRARFGSLPVLTGAYRRTALGLLGEVEWQAAGRPAWASDQYVYGYDALGRRTRLGDKRGYRWDYAYDRLDQLSEAKASFQAAPPLLPADAPVPGSRFEYTHDDVGNRVRVYNQYPAATTIEDAQDYSTNALNQYTQKTDQGWAMLSGESDPAAAMQIGVDGVVRAADRGPAPYSWKFFHARQFDNAAGALVKDVEFISAAGVWAQRALIPARHQTFAYDADGNLLEDGVWSYRWDAENRLSSVTMLPGAALSLLNAPAGQQPWLTVEFAYDSTHRRVSKRALSSLTDPTKVSEKNKVQYEWKASYAERYLYDTGSFNLLVSYRVDPQGPEAGPGVGGSFLSRGRSYAWGPDVSGTLTGAGGVGGLAVCFDDLSDSGGGSGYVGPLFPIYDGNGNLMRLYDSAGVERAAYEYGPFGEPRSRLGSQASANPFRFSTKFADDETGLVYYGYRFYAPTLGRWMSRDLIGEKDHRSLYTFVRNAPTLHVDPVGLSCFDRCRDGCGRLVTTPSGVVRTTDPQCVDRCKSLCSAPTGASCACKPTGSVAFPFQVAGGGSALVSITATVTGENPACCKALGAIQFVRHTTLLGWSLWNIDDGRVGVLSDPSFDTPLYAPEVPFDVRGSASVNFIDNPGNLVLNTTYEFVVLAMCTDGPAKGHRYGTFSWTVRTAGFGRDTIIPPSGGPGGTVPAPFN